MSCPQCEHMNAACPAATPSSNRAAMAARSQGIDRGFVRTIDAAGRGGVIAKLVLDMARSLNMSVIAEGIQQPEQLAFMQANDCDIGQGFLFSKALPADEIAGFYANWNLVTRNTLFPRETVSDPNRQRRPRGRASGRLMGQTVSRTHCVHSCGISSPGA